MHSNSSVIQLLLYDVITTLVDCQWKVVNVTRRARAYMPFLSFLVRARMYDSLITLKSISTFLLVIL